MPRYFLQMAYDGTDYSGWQIQPDRKTVQQVMEHVLSTLLRQEISVTGAGRTDTGVHASFFMAHFDLEAPPDPAGNTLSGADTEPDVDVDVDVDTEPVTGHDQPPGRGELYDPLSVHFLFRLNRFLPPDIVVHMIREVPEHMHARFSAISRTYHYHISTAKPLFTRNYTHYIYGKLDTEEINRCCGVILATTDFTSFSKLHTDVKNNNCMVTRAVWREEEDGYLFEIEANRFLRNMVRALVGTLLDVGQGKLDLQGFKEIVEARERGKAGQSAPAKGLFLVNIGY